MARARRDGVVALEFALALPLVALVLAAGLALVGLVRTSLLAHEAARLGARLAAVEADDTAVRRAVAEVVGPGVTVEVGPRVPHELVAVRVVVPVEVLALHETVEARAVAMVEPVVGHPAPPR